MTILKYFVVAFALAACAGQPSQKDRELERYLDSEISDRLQALAGNDSSDSHWQAIHQKVQNVLLFSKDIENLKASVNKGNYLFQELSGSYNVNGKDFIMLNTGMSTLQISRALKENELRFLNQMMVRDTKTDAILRSVK